MSFRTTPDPPARGDEPAATTPRPRRPSGAGQAAPASSGRSVLVGIGGGSGAGKSTVVREVVRRLGPGTVSVIQHDAYYRDLSAVPFEERVRRNFDHPDSLETALLTKHVRDLLDGRSVDAPTYDFESHTRRVERVSVAPTPIILVDGILVLADAGLRDLLDLAVFVHADAATRLRRRVRRDTRTRGRSPESVIEQFRLTVQPMHDRYVEPTREHADVTIHADRHDRRPIDRLVRRLVRLREARRAEAKE